MDSTYPAPDRDALQRAKGIIDGAQRLVILTGAGVSTASGIPDFRGPDGVWTRNPEAEKLSNIRHYMSDPAVRRKAWIARRNNPAWTAEPNNGHLALAGLLARSTSKLLITQNIDGLHIEAQRRVDPAPIDRDQIVEIHGSIRRAICTQCNWTAPLKTVLERVDAGEEDPPCPVCRGILKSSTVYFGEGLNSHDLDRSFDAASQCDVLLAVGTTLQVFPIAEVVPVAKKAGATIVIVNGEPTAMDRMAAEVVIGDIGQALAGMIDPQPGTTA